MSGALHLEFCGEWHELPTDRGFVVGRDGDLSVDDNPYLHRRFLEIAHRDNLWWLANLGSQISAMVSDPEGRFQAWLAPGVHLPVVFESLQVRFTAGPTTYDFRLLLNEPPFEVMASMVWEAGSTTLGKLVLTEDQHLLIVALAEPILRNNGAGRARIPSSSEAAGRLGWTLTKFNRKLDNVCQKFKRAGVRGLHGEPGNLASDRRARLVEYALAVRLVTAADVSILDDQNADESCRKRE